MRLLPLILFGLVALHGCKNDDSASDGDSSTMEDAHVGGSIPGACSDVHELLLWESELTLLGGGGAGGLAGMGGVTRSDGKDIQFWQLNSPSGLVQCRDGTRGDYVNSARAESCNAQWVYLPRLCGPYNPWHPACESIHMDDWHRFGDQACETQGCYAQVGCVTDDDCDAGEACICAGIEQQYSDVMQGSAPPNRCVPADCRTNEDCASGECGMMSPSNCRTESRLACRTDADECKSDFECPDVEGDAGRCVIAPDGDRWICGRFSECE